MSDRSQVSDRPSLSEEGRERLRERSKHLLGNLDRLEVGAAIAMSPDNVVNATDLHLELGLAQSRVRNQLVAMARAGVLVELPKTELRRWYRREPSPFWTYCLEQFEAWRG